MGRDARQRRRGIRRRRARPPYRLCRLKHSFKKKGDHWVPKDSKGPSDPRARKSGTQARHGKGESLGGVDYYGSTRDELYERAKKLGVSGRSDMTKKELARAIARKQ